MNRESFMSALRTHLSGMPTEERQRALRYYEEYFDDAGEENEQDVLQKIGDPAEIAKQLADSAHITQTTKKAFSKPWTFVLSILAAPIALPLIAAGLAVVAALFVTAMALLFTLFIVSFVPAIVVFALWITGIASLFIGAFILGRDFATSLVLIGTGLVAIALGALILIPYRPWPARIVVFVRMCAAKATHLVARIFQGRRKK